MPPRSGQYGRTQPTFARFSSIHRMLETPSVTLATTPVQIPASLIHSGEAGISFAKDASQACNQCGAFAPFDKSLVCMHGRDLLSAALMPPRSGQYGRTLPPSALFSSIHRMLEIAHRDRSQTARSNPCFAYPIQKRVQRKLNPFLWRRSRDLNSIKAVKIVSFCYQKALILLTFWR